jgi:hypothetical protein
MLSVLLCLKYTQTSYYGYNVMWQDVTIWKKKEKMNLQYSAIIISSVYVLFFSSLDQVLQILFQIFCLKKEICSSNLDQGEVFNIMW